MRGFFCALSSELDRSSLDAAVPHACINMGYRGGFGQMYERPLIRSLVCQKVCGAVAGAA
jgi:hypothetical protein